MGFAYKQAFCVFGVSNAVWYRGPDTIAPIVFTIADSITVRFGYYSVLGLHKLQVF